MSMRYAGEIITLNKGTENAVRVKQVTKTTARKHFNSGETVWFHASKMRLDNFWQRPCPINKADTPAPFTRDFDSADYDFKYACCDSERGNPIYFIKAE